MTKLDDLQKMGLRSTRVGRRGGRRKKAYLLVPMKGKGGWIEKNVGKEVSFHHPFMRGMFLSKTLTDCPPNCEVYEVGYYSRDVVSENKETALVRNFKIERRLSEDGKEPH